MFQARWISGPPSPGSTAASQRRSSGVGRSMETAMTTSPTFPVVKGTGLGRTEMLSILGVASAAFAPSTSRPNSRILATSAPARLAQGGIEAVDVRLHLLAAALVHDLAAHDLAGIGEAVARRRELPPHAVHAFADHHLDEVGALV